MQLLPLVLLLLCGVLTGCYDKFNAASQQIGPKVSLAPKDDVAAAAGSNPEGTIFDLAPGTYRRQAVEPKNNQRFIGSAGTVFSRGDDFAWLEGRERPLGRRWPAGNAAPIGLLRG